MTIIGPNEKNMKKLKNHLIAILSCQQEPNDHFCFFGIATDPVLERKEIDLVALAHCCYKQATLHPVLKHQASEKAIQKEYFQFRYAIHNDLNQTVGFWDKTHNQAFYSERLALHTEQFEKNPATTCFFFELCFKPLFTDALILVLAHTLHQELRKLFQSFPAKPKLKQIQASEQYLKIEQEVSSLFNTIEAHNNFNDWETERIQTIFWRQCSELSSRYGMHHKPLQPFDPDMFPSNRLIILFFVLLLSVTAILTFTPLPQG